jgi:carboxyl-terminal processing protease
MRQLFPVFWIFLILTAAFGSAGLAQAAFPTAFTEVCNEHHSKRLLKKGALDQLREMPKEDLQTLINQFRGKSNLSEAEKLQYYFALTELDDDPYSYIISQQEITEMFEVRPRIGCKVQESAGKIYLLPEIGSPVEAVGIKRYWPLKQVDGIPIQGLDKWQVGQLMTGDLKRSLRLTFDVQGDMIEKTVYRKILSPVGVAYQIFGQDYIQAPGVPKLTSAQIKAQRAGYIQIAGFEDVWQKQVIDRALSTMWLEGIQNVIIDLRYNPGGNLDCMTQYLESFVPQGSSSLVLTQVPVDIPLEYAQLLHPAVSQYMNQPQEYYILGQQPGQFKYVILVNEETASAAEVFAIFLRDTLGAYIIGVPSVGKGVMQYLIEFLTDYCLRFTIAEWRGPKGESINQVGIIPDFEMEYLYESEDDTQLISARIYLQTWYSKQ